jgi:hypothetical protein
MPLASPILAYSNPVRVKINEEFSLKAGQQIYFQDEDLKISFISVITDTRTTSGINSILNGNAEVLLIISHDGREIEACLSTNAERKSVDINNYRIILKNLMPYPADSRIIFHSRYTASLIVKGNSGKLFS